MYLLSFVVTRGSNEGLHRWMWFKSLDDVNAAGRMLRDVGFIASVQYYAQTNERDVFTVSTVKDVAKFIHSLDCPEYEEAGIPQNPGDPEKEGTDYD